MHPGLWGPEEYMAFLVPKEFRGLQVQLEKQVPKGHPACLGERGHRGT